MCLPSHIVLEDLSPLPHTKPRISRTSSSLQALPPPVDEFLRWCFVIPYSWRSITSDVGVYMAECIAIVMVGDMLLQVVGSKELKWIQKSVVVIRKKYGQTCLLFESKGAAKNPLGEKNNKVGFRRRNYAFLKARDKAW